MKNHLIFSADDFLPDVWEENCAILGVHPSAKIIKIVFNSDDVIAIYDDDEE